MTRLPKSTILERMFDESVVAGWRSVLTGLDLATAAGWSEAAQIELIGALEELKAAAAAAQAQVTAAFAASRREALTAAGVPTRRQGRSIGAEVALARRVSPHQGSRHLGLAEALVTEMPTTMAALAAGEISEWRATLVARETACLSRADRGTVDAELGRLPGGMAALGDRRLAEAARRLSYRLDPESVAARAAKAEAERCVTLRPAPDTMCYLTGLLPVGQGVAAYAALTREADARRSAGDERSRGQLMADALTERLTGTATQLTAYDPTQWDAVTPELPPASAAAGVPGAGVEVQLVMTDTALLGEDDSPGELIGYGAIPASLARRLVGETAADASVWVRRLFTSPSTGRLVSADSTRREFPHVLRQLLVARDQRCRTPWCNAPIRHADHAVSVAEGGQTTLSNGQGLCEGCNYVKETPGWTTTAEPEGTVVITTPTRHRYRSPVPPAPTSTRGGTSPPDMEPVVGLRAVAEGEPVAVETVMTVAVELLDVGSDSLLEQSFRRLLAVA